MSRFAGVSYEPVRDDARMTGQLLRIWEFVKSGSWYTLDQIASATGDPQSSVSAQLRHLRKPRFGAHDVQRNYVGNGLYHYRVIPNNIALVR